MQASLLAHAVQRLVSAHPLLASVVTHLVPHFLVPAPHEPMTQEVAWQTRVPEPAAGQVLASQVVAPHPYAGSETATHLLPHFLKLEGQVAITQVPAWQERVPPTPALGQLEESQLVAPQP
jgi:hypothetical protein